MADILTKNKYSNMTPAERKAAKAKERSRKPLRTVVHPTRIVAYLVQLTIAIYAYDFLRNHFLMLVLSLLISAPILDIIALVVLYRGVDIKLTAPERDVSRFSVGYLKLEIFNRSLMVSYDLNVKLDAESTFYGDKSGTILSLPCSAKGTYEKQIPIKYSMNGIVRYSISTFTIRDLLGFVSVKKTADAVAEVNVYPERDLAAKFDMTDMSRGMTESEESVKKGHDFSDVSDVREYIPGDKLMSIHWKLSAKRDILMVKDRVSMSDQQMVLLVELSGTDEEVDDVLTLAYAVVKRLVEEQTYVKLMWWSEGRFEFESREIMSQENLKDAYTDLYYETIYVDSERTKGYMISIHPELKAYVNVCMKDGNPEVVVVEQD
ncbi:MAG: DUF58 domain-containing protein [Eubacterium sp.]|nr:DUF58 domain-containing protein [Eubacterium sp.]